MGQIDSFKKVLGLDIEEVDPYKRILEESKAIEAAEGNGDEEEKKAMKKKGGKSPEPPSPARTSISLSRKTFARLDCYKFWLRRDCGKDYQSFSALLDAMLDEILAADEKAAAFVKKYGESR